MRSRIIPPADFDHKTTHAGQRWGILRQPTDTLAMLSLHTTELTPGQAAHDPHQHPDEEMIILLEGTLEALADGQRTVMQPGSVLLIAPNDLHGVRNNGATNARYHVLRWVV